LYTPLDCEMNEELIATCGMNCGICSRYLALQNKVRDKGIRIAYCTGCRSRKRQCAYIVRDCQLLRNRRVQYCYECADFPCHRPGKLDKRYRTNFRMSMIENLRYIKENGTRQFLVREKKKWQCPEYGDIICCHNGICFNCGLTLLENKKNLYRWQDD